MKKISVYSILIIGIAVLAYYLPYFYAITFVKKNPSSLVYYSPVIEDFTMMNIEDRKISYFDRVGNKYTLREFKSINPLMFYRDLYLMGNFPEFIGNSYVTIEEVQHQFEMISLRPKDIIDEARRIKLYPLYESKGESANLEFPKELFRINERMEFITGSTKEINEEKSSHFSNELLEKGFKFPAKLIGGNVDPKKRMDYGYFIVDSNGDIYHLRQEKGIAKADKILFPKEYGNVNHIYVREMPYALHYALVMTDKNKIYFVMKNYEVKELPIENYNILNNTLRITIDPLYYTVKIISNEKEKVYAINKDFSLKDTYSQDLQGTMSPFFEKVFSVIFPFVMYENKNNPAAPIGFQFSDKIIFSLIFNIFIAISYLIFIRRKFIISKDDYVDTLIIILTGIYGLIAILVLNKERRHYLAS